MRAQVQLLLFFLFLSMISAKFVIEPCNSSDSCNALLSYVLPWDSKVSEIASRFQVNISNILGSNSLDPTEPLIENQILPTKSLIQVPISCPCVDGIRRSVSTTYTVRAVDTIDSISVGFGGLVSPEQIRSVNGIYGGDRLVTGQSLVIPLPCTCFNNSNNGVTAVYLSYVVRSGESLSSIGAAYGTTVMDLEAVNALAQAVVDPGDILAVPIPACSSSSNLIWYNESLIVPNGSYALTANNCIKCACGLSDLNLRCFPSGIAISCSHLQCRGTNLFIGDVYEVEMPKGCVVSTCTYRGHSGKKIFRSLVKYSQIHCTGNQSYSTLSPFISPTSHGSVIPLITISPSPTPTPSPSPASNPSVTIDAIEPSTKQDSNISSDGGSLKHAPYWVYCLLSLFFQQFCVIYLNHNLCVY